MNMRKQLACGVVLAAALSLKTGTSKEAQAAKEEAKAPGPMLVHDVYFSLKDDSADARKKLVDACKKYLSKHPGEVFFAAGTRAEDLKRDVNDQDFDVALHIVFKNKEAHDKYQDAPRHLQFIKENKDNWKKVRVFDSLVEP
jgi:hypothetical protein